MPKIDIKRAHHLEVATARDVVGRIATTLQQKFGVDHHWQGDVLQFSGSGVAGAIAISSDEVHVTAQLGLLLSPFKGRIEQDIREQLERHFA